MSDRDLYPIAKDDMALLRFFLDERCQFDHHGNCQTHAMTEGRDGLCGIGRVLASVKVEPCRHDNYAPHIDPDLLEGGNLRYHGYDCDGKPGGNDE